MMPFGLRTPVVAVLLHVTGILTGGRHGLHVVSMCLPLANTSVCTPWQQGAVNVSSSMSIRDFDMALNAWAESNEHIAGFNAAYGCTWDGVGIRYAHSYGCAERLWMNDYACNSDLMAQDDATFRPLCTSSCQYYQASMGRILNDPTICAAEPTAAQSDARSATLDYIASFCANFSRSYNCSTLPSEHNRCGWANATVKGIVDYCAKVIDYDPCCIGLATLPTYEEAVQANKRKTVLVVTGIVSLMLLGATITPFVAAAWYQRMQLRRRQRQAAAARRASGERQSHSSRCEGITSTRCLRCGDVALHSTDHAMRRRHPAVNDGACEMVARHDPARYSLHPTLYPSAIMDASGKPLMPFAGDAVPLTPLFCPGAEPRRVPSPIARAAAATAESFDSLDAATDTGHAVRPGHPASASLRIMTTPALASTPGSGLGACVGSGSEFEPPSFPETPPTSAPPSAASAAAASAIMTATPVEMAWSQGCSGTAARGRGAAMADPPSSSRVGYAAMAAPSPQHIAVHPYTAALSDEVTLKVGDRVLVAEVFEDGWVRGWNWTTQCGGTFPAPCIVPTDELSSDTDTAPVDAKSTMGSGASPSTTPSPT